MTSQGRKSRTFIRENIEVDKSQVKKRDGPPSKLQTERGNVRVQFSTYSLNLSHLTTDRLPRIAGNPILLKKAINP